MTTQDNKTSKEQAVRDIAEKLYEMDMAYISNLYRNLFGVKLEKYNKSEFMVVDFVSDEVKAWARENGYSVFEASDVDGFDWSAPIQGSEESQYADRTFENEEDAWLDMVGNSGLMADYEVALQETPSL